MATENKKFNGRLQLKHDTEANWIKAVNFIPLAGEIIIYDADDIYPVRVKIGDGTTKVNDLPFYNEKGQADWNQNDSVADDYIKNRTHWVEQEERLVEFNGDLTGREYLSFKENTFGVKVSDKVLTESDLIGSTITAYYGESFELPVTADMIYIEDGAIGVMMDALLVASVSDTWNGFSKGTYFLYNREIMYDIDGNEIIEELWVQSISCLTEEGSIYHQLDENYIPDTIARIAQVENIKVDNAGHADTATKAGTASALDATGVAQVKAIKVDDATSADTADKVAYSLKFGSKTYNGSSEQTITASDLGLESAIRFIGMTSTAITDGGTQSPVVDGETHVPIRGDVVIKSSTDQEFIWNGSAWEELGNSSSHALKSITISAGTGLTGGGTLEANRTISLATSGATAGTYGAASTPSHGGTFAIPSITVDTYGRVTKATTVNVTLPADSNTDSLVKQTSVASSTTTKYPVLMSYQSSPSSGTAYEARYNTEVTIGSGVLYGAAWNDYAEYREGTDTFEPGRVICENGDDTLSLATERLQPGANVVSDTFGFAIGETEQAKTPIAVSGRVLVYPYEDRNSYAPGDVVCAAPNGTVSKMTREEIREYPERIIGTVSAIPSYETWGEGNVPVNGRIWVKIK